MGEVYEQLVDLGWGDSWASRWRARHAVTRALAYRKIPQFSLTGSNQGRLPSIRETIFALTDSQSSCFAVAPGSLCRTL